MGFYFTEAVIQQLADIDHGALRVLKDFAHSMRDDTPANTNGEYEWRISGSQLAAMSNVHRKTVEYNLKLLTDRGLLRVVEKGNVFEHKANLYALRLPEGFDKATVGENVGKRFGSQRRYALTSGWQRKFVPAGIKEEASDEVEKISVVREKTSIPSGENFHSEGKKDTISNTITNNQRTPPTMGGGGVDIDRWVKKAQAMFPDELDENIMRRIKVPAAHKDKIEMVFDAVEQLLKKGNNIHAGYFISKYKSAAKGEIGWMAKDDRINVVDPETKRQMEEKLKAQEERNERRKKEFDRLVDLLLEKVGLSFVKFDGCALVRLKEDLYYFFKRDNFRMLDSDEGEEKIYKMYEAYRKEFCCENPPYKNDTPDDKLANLRCLI